MTTPLELRQVAKVYGSGPARVQALREVDLAVEGGELVAVMGPSGSGKSTLLAITGSLEGPSSGEVLVGGSALSAMTANQQARLRRRAIGYVFQDFNLLAGLSAVENVALPLELDGVSQRAARSRGLAALEELGLAGQAGRFPDELSGGERQRVAIARALDGRDRSVVGLVENPRDLGDEFALVAPRHADPPRSVTILARASRQRAAALSAAVQVQWESRPQCHATLICLTPGQSEQATAAVGATERHVRLVLLANGAVVGAIAAVIGTAIAMASCITVAPALETATGRRIDRFDLPWWLIGAGMLLVAPGQRRRGG
jgi:ABC-type lipoprotein export system ATPase subunit